MHMRGDPSTMQRPENTTYGCTWLEVGRELQEGADGAMRAGIPAWNLVLDPGERRDAGWRYSFSSSFSLMPGAPPCRPPSLFLPLLSPPCETSPPTESGLGFSKTSAGNLELIAHLSDLRRRALHPPFSAGALLVGPSRKGFLGALTGRREAADRDHATVAAAVACVAGGGLADIVRAHNVRAVVDGLKVADALYRPKA
jgi:2-amino-4-hydroxy-6-hydroxymethyldihydropteridine diphosphokinase/dihydropteroate synthase